MIYFYNEDGIFTGAMNEETLPEGVTVDGTYTDKEPPVADLFRFVDGDWAIESREKLVFESRVNDILRELGSLDGKVIRHIEQRELGIETTLTEEEYKSILINKQELRDEMSQHKELLKGL
jgi:hypothetical protein